MADYQTDDIDYGYQPPAAESEPQPTDYQQYEEHPTGFGAELDQPAH